MAPRRRKALLAVHLTLSIAWFGALLAFLAFDIATVASSSQPTLRAAYVGMHLIAAWVILPLALGAFASGVALSLTTPWGLLRHYWVVASLVLTAAAILGLWLQLPTLADRAEAAGDPATTGDELLALGHMLPRSIGGIVVLATIIALSVFKPRGLTRHGWRKRLQAPGGSGKGR